MRIAKAARFGIPLILVLMSAATVRGQQDASRTPAADTSMQPVPTSAATTDSSAPASMAASTPASVPAQPASTETERTVVTNPSDAGKWGWLGLLGLLGLMGLRRREGEVTVVDRTVPRSTVPPVDPGAPINRR